MTYRLMRLTSDGKVVECACGMTVAELLPQARLFNGPWAGRCWIERRHERAYRKGVAK